MRRGLIWISMVPFAAARLTRADVGLESRPSRRRVTRSCCPDERSPETTSGGTMRRPLILAAALVALAIPLAATAAPTVIQPVVIQITVVNGKVIGVIKRPSVKKGRTVRFVIRTNAGTDVHLHGYDLERTPRKVAPTVMQFVARVPGRFELELHHPDALLAQLTVRP